MQGSEELSQGKTKPEEISKQRKTPSNLTRSGHHMPRRENCSESRRKGNKRIQ